MDILYTLGDGSHWNDNELKYSLRSIARFASGVGEVYLIGTHKPAFVGERVKFLKHSGNQGSSRNILAAITAACEYFQLGDFLLCADDHFYVKPANFDRYPVYLKADELPDKLSSGIYGDATYTRTLVNTRMLLDAAKLPHRNYAQHANTHFNGKRWLSLGPLLYLAQALENGVEATCLYLNAFGSSYPEPVRRKDCKICHAKNAQDVAAQIGERECFSIYDSAISEGVSDYLAAMFPDKCKYER